METILKVEIVCGPQEDSFFEGPAIFDGTLFFTNLFQSKILSLPVTATNASPICVLSLSNPCNGLGFDKQGKLFSCEIGTIGSDKHSLATVDLTNSNLDRLVYEYNEQPFHSPNDLVVTEHGIYFTDPKIPIPDTSVTISMANFLRSSLRLFMSLLKSRREQVYYYPGHIKGKDAKTCVQNNEISKPNGIGLSPDGNRLYVAESSRVGKAKLWWTELGNDHLPSQEFQKRSLENTSADGLAVRHNGDVYVASGDAIQIVRIGQKKPQLIEVGTIHGLEGYKPSNLCFVNEDCLIVTLNKFSWLGALFGYSTAMVARITLSPTS